MAIVEKRIGNTTYHYNVVWDKVNKKQKWIQIDKKTDNEIVASKFFSPDDINQIKYAYQLSEQHNYTIPKNALKLICERLNIEL